MNAVCCFCARAGRHRLPAGRREPRDAQVAIASRGDRVRVETAAAQPVLQDDHAGRVHHQVLLLQQGK